MEEWAALVWSDEHGKSRKLDRCTVRDGYCRLPLPCDTISSTYALDSSDIFLSIRPDLPVTGERFYITINRENTPIEVDDAAPLDVWGWHKIKLPQGKIGQPRSVLHCVDAMEGSMVEIRFVDQRAPPDPLVALAAAATAAAALETFVPVPAETVAPVTVALYNRKSEISNPNYARRPPIPAAPREAVPAAPREAVLAAPRETETRPDGRPRDRAATPANKKRRTLPPIESLSGHLTFIRVKIDTDLLCLSGKLYYQQWGFRMDIPLEDPTSISMSGEHTIVFPLVVLPMSECTYHMELKFIDDAGRSISVVKNEAVRTPATTDPHSPLRVEVLLPGF